MEKSKITVTPEQVKENMQDVIVRTETEFGKPCTYVTVRMKNGFTLRESTTCVDPANYDEEIGKKICLEKIEDKVWFLLGYALQEEVYREDCLKRWNGTFSIALYALKEGKKVARKGWNGKGMFLYYVPAAQYAAMTDIAKDTFGENAMVQYDAYIAIKNAQGSVSIWNPSQVDMFADDWFVVE